MSFYLDARRGNDSSPAWLTPSIIPIRLEQVVLVGVWTEGTVAEVEATMAELAAGSRQMPVREVLRDFRSCSLHSCTSLAYGRLLEVRSSRPA